MDFYDLKGDVEVLLGLNTADEFEFRPGQHPALHPGKTAQILRNNLPVGWVGALHPEILNYFKISYQVFVFEIDYISISSAKRVPHYREMSRFPSIRRDIAVVVDDSVTAQSVFDCLKNISSDFLQELQLFDMFTGKGIDSGKKSLALCLILQHRDRTLTDDEVDTLVGQVVSLLEQQLDAKLRD